jgi:hypothetical protein
LGDRAYDAEAIRCGVRARHIVPCWLCVALRVRYDKRADIHEAFLSLGCALICWLFLRQELG